MLEAMWAVTFASNVTGVANVGGGIVVLETGRVLGGDVGFTYIGDYKGSPDGKRVTAKVHVRRYRVVPGQESVFGPLEAFDLELAGTPARDVMVMSGNVVGKPEMRINVTFHRLEELP
jgi:hypothetical protein